MKNELTYIDSVHRAGRIWNLSVMVILMLFPVAVSLIFDAPIDWRGFALGMIAGAAMAHNLGTASSGTGIGAYGIHATVIGFAVCLLIGICNCKKA